MTSPGTIPARDVGDDRAGHCESDTWRRAASELGIGGGKRGNADDVPVEVDEGTAAVARIYRRTGLDGAGEHDSVGFVQVRPRALTIPSVTELRNPSGLPIASTMSPTRRRRESPNDALVSGARWACTTATSSGLNMATTVALYAWPEESVTCREPPPATT